MGKKSASYSDFIGIPRKVADSEAFRSLPPIARALYVDLRRQHNGYNNGQIAAVLKGTEDRPGLQAFGWAPRTVYKSLKKLIAHGLIERVRQGGIDHLSKTCSLYAFTDLAVVANKEKGIAGAMPSLAYLQFTPPPLSAPRTRKKRSQAAPDASIAARGARTQLHAVPSDPLIAARGAVGAAAEK